MRNKQPNSSWKKKIFIYSCILFICTAFFPKKGDSLQSLTTFLEAASTNNLDQKEASLFITQRNYEWKQALSRLFPTLSANATYTHNEPKVELPTSLLGMGMGGFSGPIVISPQDQIEAVFSLNIPLVDVASWYRAKAADKTQDSARFRSKATWLEVQKTVAKLYYQYIAAGALVKAAERTLLSAQENQNIVKQRVSAGIAIELDFARATSEVARAEQSKADALLTQFLSGRSLETLTGIKPEGDSTVQMDVLVLEASLQKEDSVDSWQKQVDQLPNIRAARIEGESAKTNKTAAWLAYAPTLSGALNERLTNASGFAQRNDFFSATLHLSWRADVGTIFAAKAAETSQRISALRVERAIRDAKEQVDQTWHQIQTYQVRSQSAKIQLQSSQKAAELAHVRYDAGVATQLDVTQAERDLFSAEVSKIQTDADLLYARTLLRLQAGQSLLPNEK